MSQKTIRPFHIFQKALKRFLKVIYSTQQLQVRENVVGFEKALGSVKVIKDQIQHRSQRLLNLARDYFSCLTRQTFNRETQSEYWLQCYIEPSWDLEMSHEKFHKTKLNYKVCSIPEGLFTVSIEISDYWFHYRYTHSALSYCCESN